VDYSRFKNGMQGNFLWATALGKCSGETQVAGLINVNLGGPTTILNQERLSVGRITIGTAAGAVSGFNAQVAGRINVSYSFSATVLDDK